MIYDYLNESETKLSKIKGNINIRIDRSNNLTIEQFKIFKSYYYKN